MKKLAVVTTHPIQYYAPVFKLLQQRSQIGIKVFYTWGKQAEAKFDPGFNKAIEWDIPLLEGYTYEWVENTSPQPGSHYFKGIINPELINSLKSWQPDAVLVIGWSYQSHLKVIRYFKGKVLVLFRGDSTLLDEKKGLKSILRSVFLTWLYRHVDHAFYVGTNSKAYFKKYGLKQKQLSFAPHAIDNDRFAFKRDEETLLLRKSLSLGEGDILILFAGKLEEKKAPQHLLAAFLSINKPNVHLLFAGNGPLENELKQMSGDNALVHFMEFQNQSQMPVVYQACDLFCLPSVGPGETWGLAINEAMACSKAIIASNKVGCAVDLVKDGVNGSVFKAGDVSDLTSKLQELTHDLSQLKTYGRESQRIIKDWNFTKIAEAIENKLIYETD
ncbi:glycosyltransferase family 4 protein [Mucilaginibacter sp. X4EP1]|uniref:glycosyltransferase family 4 protein n=1 Tax=Mucilaginibacter sp. X4EP1 TaxID=2723092 RepID=UPI002169EDD9|nr:glycosyltransferase family 4 protein [Mucilaginibacter sp. X4EP1]MCS3811703.1 glycosyltransferase involved in cell wall biosynthesis [Mucilaginibacter sp. X4EP1]